MSLPSEVTYLNVLLISVSADTGNYSTAVAVGVSL